MAEAALVLAPLDVLEHEVQEALAICGGDPMKALRITLIANAFLEAQIDHLSAGYARRKKRKDNQCWDCSLWLVRPA